jgi:hypothetical protein
MMEGTLEAESGVHHLGGVDSKLALAYHDGEQCPAPRRVAGTRNRFLEIATPR